MGWVWKILKWFKDAWSWTNIVLALLGYFGLAAFVIGAATAIGGGVWSVMIGIPLPIAIMVGFCVLVMGVYLSLAPLVYRALARTVAISKQEGGVDASVLLTGQVEAEKKRTTPVYAAWRHREVFDISEAAKLWCDVDPHVSGNKDTQAWIEAFKAAAEREELDIVTSYPEDRQMRAYERKHPDATTKITKRSLREFAKAHGHDPEFLRD
jgi:hypothetical protein